MFTIFHHNWSSKLSIILYILLVFAHSVLSNAQEFVWTPLRGTFDYQIGPNVGVRGEPGRHNHPAPRWAPGYCYSPENELWIYGGEAGNVRLNDLWKLDLGTGYWTWFGGDNESNSDPVYGPQGEFGIELNPGGRAFSALWSDGSGCLWLFGGAKIFRSGTNISYGDMWKFDPISTEWGWVGGNQNTNLPGVRGNLGVRDANNFPGARRNMAFASGPGNEFWMFGGVGFDDQRNSGVLNDIWNFDPVTHQWVWLGGSPIRNEHAFYGDRGVSSAEANPGGRFDSAVCMDSMGNLWIFGGGGFDQDGNEGALNDLWKYETTSGVWTWVAGRSIIFNPGTYGTKGLPASNNEPGSRERASIWIDEADQVIWLSGGEGYDRAGDYNELNDLWKYDIRTDQWTWIKGTPYTSQSEIDSDVVDSPEHYTPSARNAAAAVTDNKGRFLLFGGSTDPTATNFYNRGYELSDLWRFDPDSENWERIQGKGHTEQPGRFGNLGFPSTETFPSARISGATWTDHSGLHWLFGGLGVVSKDNHSYMNDMFKFDQDSGLWTWVSGNQYFQEPGHWGEMGVSSPENFPSPRYKSVTWTGEDNTLWLYGGYGRDTEEINGNLSDLWKYDIASGVWTWMSGPNIRNLGPNRPNAVYPSEPGYRPGSKEGALGWIGPNGDLWMFGGRGYNGFNSFNTSIELWKYSINNNEWTWYQGNSLRDNPGIYGELGIPEPTNTPGSRRYSCSWTDAMGDFWLFGGYGDDINGTTGRLNDFWRYDPDSDLWTWMGGSSTFNGNGNYGALGTPSPEYLPAAREQAVFWKDVDGNFWLFGGQYTNDVWKCSSDTGEWTWWAGQSGSDATTQIDIENQPSTANSPGRRVGAMAWSDGGSGVWVFGGFGPEASGHEIYLDEFWFGELVENGGSKQ